MRIAFKEEKKLKVEQNAFTNDLCVFKIQMNKSLQLQFLTGEKNSLLNAKCNANEIKIPK